MAKNLVIVESPAKARTIGRFLGRSYVVKASLGHVRDLPQNTLGVAVDGDFQPEYEIPEAKRGLITELNQALEGVSTVYLATDPDREGEAIAWHLTQAADMGQRAVRRVVFHEITEPAIREAFLHPREIDLHLVDAQQARRVLDRLVGYLISPLLWDSVKRGLSAGRVQSVALRMVVDREREIEAFQPREYWRLVAELAKREAKSKQSKFLAVLEREKGQSHRLEVHNQEQADAILKDLEGASYRIAKVARKETQRRPTAPFTTSTLQQEAWRKLRLSAQRTMRIAQQLYEGLPIGAEGSVGLITYMRTDSPTVSASAVQEARAYIKERYGAEYVPKAARAYTARSKGAQEAHEAIRPTSIHHTPDSIKQHLEPAQLRLYDLVWKRMVASQMANAVFDSTAVDIDGSSPRAPRAYVFHATGSVMKFHGFSALYSEGKDTDDDDDEGALPSLAQGEVVNILGLDPQQKFTQPPPRYTEASLVKELEENGIGRPSTYAPTVATIQERDYVRKEEGKLNPTGLGKLVSDLLTKHFTDIMDPTFTATMEEDLDEVARAKRPWLPLVKEFYEPFSKSLEEAERSLSSAAVGEANPTCEKCGRPMALKESRWKSKFWGCTGYPECRNTKSLKLQEAKAVLEEATEEICEKCEAPMVIKTGRFGRFLACTRYPECRNTRRIQVKVGVQCPECGGDLVEKKSRKNKTFYGCARYPDCEFATNLRPIPEPCPNCSGLLTAFPRGGVRCTKCEYKGGRPRPSAQEMPEPVVAR